MNIIKKKYIIITIFLLIIFLTAIPVTKINTQNAEIKKLETESDIYKDIIDDLNKELSNEILKNEQKEVNYMYGEATAYHPWSGGINSDEDPDITSTGEQSREGIIAVHPDVIPYGSEILIIDGNSVIRGEAQDTGGFRFENPHQVDILMEDYEEAKEFGRRKVHILWW
ncbi:MAG: 3D domain-containing protein [Nanoarchaeota archaeon]